MVLVTAVNHIYKCSVCGNIFEVLHVGGGEPVCCGKPSILLEEKNSDIGKEKHVPIIRKTTKGILVKVGSILHPMEKEHYIEFIELIADGMVYKKFLKPGDKPEAVFEVKATKLMARIYCNVHSLWKS